jgi:multiple sugar transport system ATP-binding protein
MVSVRLEGLTKAFGPATAVDNLSLEIADGKFTCLLGPSGCGKTTTLRMIAGLEFQDEGSIYFGEKCIDQLLPGDRNVSLVFQFYAIYPNMNVYDEIAFPLKMQKRPEAEIRDRVKKVSQMVGLHASLNQRASKMGVDEKQRIELARAIIKEPDVFLFDEPLTNLDASVRASMRAEIARIQKELKTTTIYVTHDQLEAMALGDKIAIMNQGKLIQYDTPTVVYEKPKDLFVAGFVGTPPMNFLEGIVVSRNDSTYIDCEGLSVKIGNGSQDALKRLENDSVILGIRPENIIIDGSVSENSYPATVDIVEPAGRRMILNVKIGKLEMKINTQVFSISSGAKVNVSFPVSQLRVFDKASGQVVI